MLLGIFFVVDKQVLLFSQHHSCFLLLVVCKCFCRVLLQVELLGLFLLLGRFVWHFVFSVRGLVGLRLRLLHLLVLLMDLPVGNHQEVIYWFVFFYDSLRLHYLLSLFHMILDG